MPKGRKLAGAALAVVAMVTLTACPGEELNRWGARIRGAPVTTSYKGHPYYVTGPAGVPNGSNILSYEGCKALAIADQGVPDYLGPLICSVNREWIEGQHGYDQD